MSGDFRYCPARYLPASFPAAAPAQASHREADRQTTGALPCICLHNARDRLSQHGQSPWNANRQINPLSPIVQDRRYLQNPALPLRQMGRHHMGSIACQHPHPPPAGDRVIAIERQFCPLRFYWHRDILAMDVRPAYRPPIQDANPRWQNTQLICFCAAMG